MSDIMRPMSFSHLMNWVLTEYGEHGAIFGVQAAKFPRHAGGEALSLFGEKLEAPYGPAAGPHPQLAQNLIAAYVSGCRFFELKTVQIMDGEELSKCVAKPCITAGDECYNCEWSTELTVPQAMAEYIKAWFACKLLARELELGDPDGFIFNMSVGYDLEGIRSAKIDAYLEGMKDASSTDAWKACMDWTLSHLDRFRRVDEAYVKAISPAVSRSVTESTLHGCPPDEIERIASYLITEKGLNTYVKCNPTLLGYDFARETLDRLGFGYVTFDDHHFREDLQMADALPMFRRLETLARTHGVEFGVKLTNTFPVDVAAGELPSQEMYMSGRALYPLTLSLAARLSRAFGGKLRISYSGGAEARNIKALFDAGIWPITMATTVLKPGGYERFCQIGEILKDSGSAPWAGVDTDRVEALAAAVSGDPLYQKPIKPIPSKKMADHVPLIDCFTAPCRSGCPIHQDIPAYLKLVDEGRYAEAFQIILQRNALPFITGTICPHHCADKCMRGNYDEAIHIRDAKLTAAREAFGAMLHTLVPKAPRRDRKVAVVGGGPAGMAAAFYLGREGVPVTIYEATGALGGVVRHIIPSFRISDEAIDRDEQIIRAMGAEVKLNSPISSCKELEGRGYTHILFATGAQKAGDPRLKYGDYVNFTEVLAAIKTGAAPDLGTDVAVIGGGNSAMDTARAVKRLPGVARVRLVYRRTRQYMPAEEEELRLAMDEGVEFLELLAPIGVKDGVLTCSVMELGAPDASGRRSPVDTGRTLELPCTTLIAAVGERIDETVDVGNCPVIGDRRRGPATVVEAMADALAAAQDILGSDAGADRFAAENAGFDRDLLRAGRGRLCADRDACGEPGLCLGCAAVCETCVSVCPNRANISVEVPGLSMPQIVHVDGMCNECGNCAAFCPYDSAPYRDKFTLFWSEEDFRNSRNDGWLPAGDGSGVCQVRLGEMVKTYDVTDPGCGLYDPLRRLILAVREDYGYLVR
ncbi:MAG: putative selenate reductase subunit YgfK [Clostridiales bacterium]|nr:putative selenate reductase subunit YgfK [Clostridiales bacterium]